MKRPNGALTALFLFSLLTAAIGFAALNPDPRLQIILDVSGSMAGDAGGQAKIDAAREAILSTLDALDEGTLVPGESERPYFLTSLRMYGHSLPREPKAASCEDTELVIPFQPLDRSRFVEVLDGASPSGQTPIARSLREAADDFGEIGEDPAVVILVSDGEETCGGDPVAAACELEERGFDLTVHTVGFDVGAEARGQLEGVAECTGGEYRDAGDADQLGQSLQELTASSMLIEKEATTRGTPIRGGDGYEDAVSLEPGTLYHLDHHQREDEFDYFRVEVESGQKIVATITSYEETVCIDGDEVVEGCSPGAGFGSAAGIGLHGPDRSEIGYEETYIDSNREVGLTLPLGTNNTGTYYVLVGARQREQHMASPFEVELVDMFDAGSRRDAGPRYTGAVEIGPGEYSGWLHRNDHTDFYQFGAEPSGTYSIRARPVDADKRLELELIDADGVVLEDSRAPNSGAAVTIEGFVPEDEGTYYAKVGTAIVGRDLESEYSLSLTAEGVEEPEEEEELDAQAADDEGGLSPWLILLALVLVGAALAGGIVLGRRPS